MHKASGIFFIAVVACLIFTTCNFTPEDNKINNIKLLNRKTFCVQYPSTWSVDSLEKGYNPDSSFTIVNAEGTAFASFLIFDHYLSEKERADYQMNGRLKLMVYEISTSEFSEWGNYIGQGTRARGKIMGMFPGIMSAFTHISKEGSFVVVTQVYKDERETNLPGLELIESSFKLKDDRN